MKNKLLSFGMVLVVSMSVVSPANAVSLATLKNSLSKYCIASPDACGTVTAPIFDTQKNSCVCYNSNYQQYDANQRKCVIKCPAGHKREINLREFFCPSGTKRISIEKRALYSYER